MEVGAADLVIVEGCYSARPELRAYYDAIILVVASTAERERRQQMRNDASSEWLGRWDAAERWYMEHCRPNDYADLTVRYD
jgi:uridine kinase